MTIRLMEKAMRNPGAAAKLIHCPGGQVTAYDVERVIVESKEASYV